MKTKTLAIIFIAGLMLAGITMPNKSPAQSVAAPATESNILWVYPSWDWQHPKPPKTTQDLNPTDKSLILKVPTNKKLYTCKGVSFGGSNCKFHNSLQERSCTYTFQSGQLNGNKKNITMPCHLALGTEV